MKGCQIKKSEKSDATFKMLIALSSFHLDTSSYIISIKVVPLCVKLSHAIKTVLKKLNTGKNTEYSE